VPDAAFRRPVATSRGFATLRGLWNAGSGRLWVSARPPAVRHRPGWSSYGPRRCSRSRDQALLALTCPFRDQIPAAPHRGAASPIRRPKRRLVPQCCLSWGFVPYDTLSDRRIRKMAVDPSTTACHVRGLATSFAASTTGPTGARSAGASMGFALQGVPLGASGAPLGALALLTLPATPPPKGVASGGRLQGLVPATSPCCHRAPKGTRSSIPSWASPLQSAHSIRPGDRL
jgi:hypothetical protein